VAVLLDNFITASAETQQEKEHERISDMVSRRLFGNALDPLLEQLAQEYTDDADLSARLQSLFKVICRERLETHVERVLDVGTVGQMKDVSLGSCMLPGPPPP
jgi:phage gp29-like protein